MRKRGGKKTVWKRGMAVCLAAIVAAQTPMSCVAAEDEETVEWTAQAEYPEEEEELIPEVIEEEEQLSENTAENSEEALQGQTEESLKETDGEEEIGNTVPDEEWILGDVIEEAAVEAAMAAEEEELLSGDIDSIIWATNSSAQITAGGSYTLSDILGSDTSQDRHIEIATTEAVTLDGESTEYSALTISACKNSNLTIKDLYIADTKSFVTSAPYGTAESSNPLILCENAVLTVKGTNNLSGNCAWNEAGGAILIAGANVKIQGDGTLDVASNNTNVAAIGLDPHASTSVSGNISSEAASVIIEDNVTINAESQNANAVAIGTRGGKNLSSGEEWSGTNKITIQGNAEVTATSANSSQGNSVALGGCAQSYITNLEIYIGGNATVITNNQSSAGATVTLPKSVGIGVGSSKASSSTVKITIADDAQISGSGICAGTNASSSIKVTGGDIQLSSTKEFALLAHQIDIEGGKLTVKGIKASAIAGDIINISGGTIVAEANGGFAGIGMYDKSTPVSITISGGIVKATGGSNAAGIGAINGSTVSTENTIVISGGTVWAKGGGTYSDGSGAGIGGAKGTSGGTIQIGEAAVVTAIGGRVSGIWPSCDSTAKGIGAGGACSEDTTSLIIESGARVLCFSPNKTEGALAMPKCKPDPAIGIWGQFAEALTEDTTVTVYFDGSAQGEEIEIPCYTSAFAFTTCKSVTLEKEDGEIIKLPGENTATADGVYAGLEWKSGVPSLEGAVLTVSNVIKNIEIAFAGDKTFTYTVTALAGGLTNGEYDLSAPGAQTPVAEAAITYKNGTAEDESVDVTLPSMTSGSDWYYLVYPVQESSTEEDTAGTWSYDGAYLVKVTVDTDESGEAAGTFAICKGIISGTTFSLLPGAEEEESSEVVFTNVYEEYQEHGASDPGAGGKELSDGVHKVGAYTYLDTDAWYEQIEDADEKYTLVHGHYDAEKDLFYYIIPKNAYDKVVLDGTQYVECLIARYTNINWDEDPSPWHPGSMKNIPWCVINASGSTYDYEDCGFYLSDSVSDSIGARYYMDEVEPRSAAAAATASGSNVADFRKVLRTASTPLQYLYGPVAGTEAEAPITSREELSSAITPVGIWKVYHAEEKVKEVYSGKYNYEEYILHFYNDILQAGNGAESIAELPLSCRMNLLGYSYLEGRGISVFPWYLFTTGNYTMSLNDYQKELIEEMEQAPSVYESADGGTYRLYGMIEPSVEIQEMAYQSFYRDALKFTFDYERDPDNKLLISSQSGFETATYATEIMGWSTLCALTREQAFLVDNLDEEHDSTEQTAVDSIAATVGTIHILGGYNEIFNNSLLSLQGLTTPNAYFGAAMLYGLGMDITLRANREEYDFGLLKKDEDGTQLAGAVFTLSTESGDTVSFIRTETDDAVIYTYTADAAAGSTETIVSAAEKETAVYGMPQGIYYLKETEASAKKYALNDTVYKIEVTTTMVDAEEDSGVQTPEPLIRVYECREGEQDVEAGYTQESQGEYAVIEMVNLWKTEDTTLRIVKKVTGSSTEFSGTEEFSFAVSELEGVAEQENRYAWKQSSAAAEAVRISYQSAMPEKAFAEVKIGNLKYGSVHYYLIREEDLKNENWSCDKTVWLVKVSVDEEGSVAKAYLAGTEADGIFHASGQEKEEAEFTNQFFAEAVKGEESEKTTENGSDETTEENSDETTEESSDETEDTETETEKDSQAGGSSSASAGSGQSVNTADETELGLWIALMLGAVLLGSLLLSGLIRKRLFTKE